MQHTKVRLPDGRVLPLEVIYETRETRERYLKPFHKSSDRPTCQCCSTKTDLELVIRCTDGDYRLTCYKGTTAEHRSFPKCYFYSPSLAEVAPAYTRDAVRTEGDRLIVTLEHGLKIKAPTADKGADEIEAGKQPVHRTTVKRNTVKLLGLLNIIWQQAGLNRWYPLPPGKCRRYGDVELALCDAAERISIPAGSLGDLLYVPSHEFDEGGAKIKRMLHKLPPNQCIIVIGELLGGDSTSSGAGFSVALTCLKHCNLYFKREYWDQCVESHKIPIRDDKVRTWMIAMCYLTPKGFIAVKEAAWMRCSREYIPFQSEYEQRFIETLVYHRRIFTKPLRFDTQAEEAVFPDGILHDVAGGDYPMEVWGRDDPDYLERMKEKVRIYNDRVWQWHAYRKDNMPPFPIATASILPG